MTETENLYIVAAEECAEIQQCISKILRFGEQNYHPDRPDDTNARELLTEYYQLQSVMDMILERGLLGYMSESEIEIIKQRKRYKVSDYAQLSKTIGRIKE